MTINWPELLTAIGAVAGHMFVMWRKGSKDSAKVKDKLCEESKYTNSQIYQLQTQQHSAVTAIGLLTNSINDLRAQQAATRLSVQDLKLSVEKSAKETELAIKEIERSKQQWINETLLMIKGKKP